MQHPDFESFDATFYKNRYSSPNHVNVVPFWPPVKHSKYHPENDPMILSCKKSEPEKLEITTSFPASVDVFEALAVSMPRQWQVDTVAKRIAEELTA